jgi:predicted GIY-YIG superfamily endonuclease
MSNSVLYVLECIGSRYYVGKTKDSVDARFAQHLQGGSESAAWTRLYPPVRVVEIRAESHKFAEDNVTLEYMDKFGIHAVRGGSWCSVRLDTVDFQCIRKQLWHANGRCIGCGSKQHMISRCGYQLSKKKPVRNSHF